MISATPTGEIPSALTAAEAIDAMPDRMTLVGSMGRAILMGQPPATYVTSNGHARDLDVIDPAYGAGAPVTAGFIGPHRVDAGMTRTFRPYDNGDWGLFMPGADEPLVTVPGELCEPQRIAIPWQPDRQAVVVPVAIQLELLDITAPYHKHRSHTAAFRAFAASQSILPSQIRQEVGAFRHARWHAEYHGMADDPLSLAEQLYRRARHSWYVKAPDNLQHLAERGIGRIVRAARHTTDLK